MADSTAPKKLDILKSVRSYFELRGPRLTGEIKISQTASGQKFYIYLPPGYQNGTQDHQVLYHLHGAGALWRWVGKDIQWTAEQHEKSVRAHNHAEGDKRLPMVIVAPYDPSKFSMWSNSVDDTNRRADAVLEELIPHVETNYRVLTNRGSRLLQGFSMGGFGAATWAFKYQDRFAAVVLLDGAYHNWETMTGDHAKIATRQYNDSEEIFNEWSPWVWAERADLLKIPIFVVVGLLTDFADRYTAHLEKLNARVTTMTTGCLHDVRCIENNAGARIFDFFAEHSNMNADQ